MSVYFRESSCSNEEANSVGEPELYCFEDYHPLKPQPRSCSPVDEKENIFFSNVSDDDR